MDADRINQCARILDGAAGTLGELVNERRTGGVASVLDRFEADVARVYDRVGVTVTWSKQTAAPALEAPVDVPPVTPAPEV